jgi:hypothetical protein
MLIKEKIAGEVSYRECIKRDESNVLCRKNIVLRFLFQLTAFFAIIGIYKKKPFFRLDLIKLF